MDAHSDETASGDSSTVLGSSSSSQDKEEEDHEQSIEERLEELPERPATSLGIRESQAPPSAKRPTRITRRNPLGFASFPKPKPVPPPKASPPPSPQEGTLPAPISDCLHGCVIFVDVRTDEGSDASAMFIDMLRSLSARVRF